MNELKFSVLLCVNKFNPWLEKAINSILNQTHQEFELLIAANLCSNELWEQLIKITANDTRVKLFRTSIGQLAFNLNFLTNYAKGEYLVRMDADDISEVHRLSFLNESLNIKPLDILGSAVVLIDENDELIGQMEFGITQKNIWQQLPYKTVFCHPAIVIRKEFLINLRGYIGGLASEDTDLWLRTKRAGGLVANLKEPLLRYRIHSSQSILSKTGYAEVSGHWLREFMISPSIYYFIGLTVSILKALFFKRLPGAKRYKKKT